MSVGFIGIGFMGKGMARNILKKYLKENDKINIFDISSNNINEFLSDAPVTKKDNIKICSSPSEVATLSNIIALSLPSDTVTDNVLFGDSGITTGFQNKSNKSLVIDHGTFSVQFVRDCHQKALVNGFSYIDGPVSGGPEGARRATLSVMLGGSIEDIRTAEPLLKCYSSNIFHFGQVGSGMAAKLVNQALVSMHAAAASEAIYLSQRFGLKDIKLVAEMLRESWGQSKVLDLSFDDFINSQLIGSEVLKQTKAPLRNLRKDLHCISNDLSNLKKSETNDFNLPLLNSTTELIDHACENGLKDSAFVSLINLIESNKNLKS